MAGWSRLPKDLLVLIAKRLDTSEDLSRFRYVCSTWRSSVAPKRRLFSDCVPMLPDDNTNFSTGSCGLLSKCTVFLVQSPQRATSWLIKIEEDTHDQKRLIYPLNRHRLDFRKVLDIQNLSIYEIGHGYVLNYVDCHRSSKVALMHIGNSKSDSDGFVLLTVHGSGELAMFKSGHEKWTILQHMQPRFDDVIVYKGRFYAVHHTGRTVIVDCSGCSVNLVESPVFGDGKKYLVECKGDLLLVDMSAIFGPYMDRLQPPAYFGRERTAIYKLDEERKEWTNMTDLKDDLLFLGEDCVFSVSANKLGVSRRNCILFVYDVYGSSEDEADDDAHRRVRVFDLETGRIEPLGNCPELSELFWPPPGWTFPSIVEHDRKCEANDGHHGRQQAVGKVAAQHVHRKEE